MTPVLQRAIIQWEGMLVNVITILGNRIISQRKENQGSSRVEN